MIVLDRISLDIVTIASRLAGHDVAAAVPLGRGGNSRVYRIESDKRHYVLKAYPAADGRERLRRECAALEFLNAHGLEVSVPRPVAADEAGCFGLYSWLDGTPIGPHTSADIDQMIAFAAALHRLSGLAAAQSLGEARESCLSAAELLHQIDARLERLDIARAASPDLADFLGDRFMPALAAARIRLKSLYGAAGVPIERMLEPRHRILSPSDFGFHNCLRQSDGRLVFLDFEYFGWDDPIRLVLDFLCHPAMALEEADRRHFLAGTSSFLDEDPSYARRVAAAAPLVALRWCLILLNEFLPGHWNRRSRASGGSDWSAAKTRQLAKAVTMLEHHETLLGWGSA